MINWLQTDFEKFHLWLMPTFQTLFFICNFSAKIRANIIPNFHQKSDFLTRRILIIWIYSWFVCTIVLLHVIIIRKHNRIYNSSDESKLRMIWYFLQGQSHTSAHIYNFSSVSRIYRKGNLADNLVIESDRKY